MAHMAGVCGMIDKLLEVVKPKRKILILTHNNPDPDTIASAQGLKMILTTKLQKRCTIAFDGIVGRAENRELIKTCNIEMHHSGKLTFSRYDFLIVVDTQPTAGNVTIPKNTTVHAIIDHHNLRVAPQGAIYLDIRPEYGATSTIIAEYLKRLNIVPDNNTATALYYGIKSDTMGSARGNSKHDVDMMVFLFPNISVKKLLRIESPELPKYHFRTMKNAIERAVIIEDLVFCDLGDVRNADLIAETSDYLARMRDLKGSFVIGKIDNNCHFSLRNKSPRKKVGQIAQAVVKGIGTGGGHMKSAGGQIPLTDIKYEEVVALVKERLLQKLGITSVEEKTI